MSQNNAIKNQCRRWMHDYVTSCAWEMFVAHDVVDFATRNIIWGLHQDDLEEDLHKGQTHLLAILCLVSIGNDSDVWPRWLEQEGIMPLEKAADVVRELDESFSVLEGATDSLVEETAAQAVIQCCLSREFRVARDALTRLTRRRRTGLLSKETYSKLQTLVETKDLKHEVLKGRSYADYIQKVKDHLGKAFNSFDMPFLFRAAQRVVLEEGTQAEDNEQLESPVQKKLVERHGFVAPRYILPSKLQIGSEDINAIFQKAKQSKAEKNNKDPVLNAMRERLGRDRTRNVTGSQQKENRDIIHRLDGVIKKMDQMRDERHASEMAVIRDINGEIDNDRLSSGDEDENDDFQSIRPLPSLKRRGSIDERLLRLQGKKPYKTQQRVPWSETETEKLRRAVGRFGEGRWAEIRQAYNFGFRTSVNLKDRWRTITKGKK